MKKRTGRLFFFMRYKTKPFLCQKNMIMISLSRVKPAVKADLALEYQIYFVAQPDASFRMAMV